MGADKKLFEKGNVLFTREQRGNGTSENPYREILCIYDTEGWPICEYDPTTNKWLGNPMIIEGVFNNREISYDDLTGSELIERKI